MSRDQDWLADFLSRLKEEDRVLIDASESDLKKEAYIFSFIEEDMCRRVRTGEPWQQVVQAHLYLDHILSRMLKDALVFPEEVNASRMNFSQKMRLLAAMGLVDKKTRAAFEYVNKLRNGIAHDLEFSITDDEISKISRLTPKYIKDIAIRQEDRVDTGEIKFHEVLEMLVYKLETDRQEFVLGKLREKQAQLHLLRSMENGKNALAQFNRTFRESSGPSSPDLDA